MGEMVIKQLDDKLIDKIAAGEVVENPSSVIKELIENSIDSGANSIEVELREGGKSYIRVTDNGSGMSAEDAKVSIKRHTTSKIKSESDLFAIKSLGFRGEALASICAVSDFTLQTRKEETTSGYQIRVHGNNIDMSEKGCEKGTTILVENLFYNVPARRKFLKDINVELAHCTEIITRFVLSYSNIAFRFISDDKLMISTSHSEDNLNNISSIYGKEIAKGMIKVKYEDEYLGIDGYIGRPSIARNDKTRQTIFINGRYVKNKDISDSIKDGFYSMLFLELEPVYILKIHIEESRIDVNVHPKKEIVKISNVNLVKTKISQAIRETLSKTDLVLEANLKQTKANAVHQYTMVKDTQSQLEVGKEIFNEEMPSQVENVYQNLISTAINKEITTEHIGPFRILGQINRTYIVCESSAGLIIIDQHAAEERVNYEKLRKMHGNKSVNKQILLKPIIVELTPAEIQTVKTFSVQLASLGFDFEEYGNNSIVVRTMPFVFERPSKAEIHELITELIEIDSSRLTTQAEERIIRWSCRKSIKAGEEMNIKEMSSLIEELDKCDMPFTCPHGRPTIIRIGISEIEKKFKRTG